MLTSHYHFCVDSIKTMEHSEVSHTIIYSQSWDGLASEFTVTGTVTGIRINRQRAVISTPMINVGKSIADVPLRGHIYLGLFSADDNPMHILKAQDPTRFLVPDGETGDVRSYIDGEALPVPLTDISSGTTRFGFEDVPLANFNTTSFYYLFKSGIIKFESRYPIGDTIQGLRPTEIKSSKNYLFFIPYMESVQGGKVWLSAEFSCLLSVGQ